MSPILETRTEICRYGNEDIYLTELEKFGWILSSKRIVYRNGTPLPLDTSYSEEVLRERFYVELTLERNVDDEVRVELNKLQREYDSLKPQPRRFGKGRVVGSVFISLLSFSCLIYAWPFYAKGDMNNFVTFLSLAIVFGAPIIPIFITGIRGVVKYRNDVEAAKVKRAEIADMARELLESKK